ncbi:DUF3667 domain-containing protein [Sphingomonas desiccabilis]|uniref:DUF3667 domain-containing protein n=1 Tax=Sphingomonas desiccabilis TaxID=429134 RepID=A0A4Q2ITA9_9SPHN|nr:DUF3667 domain-containing protein [Sphingomonas desiccabilis]MBB3911659.1 hypothetical protein [Sphingomonas desiccabilis]RXZ31608.1 DUF3667 domain-containing protein [Sphingomonas desiccabilis]
MGELETGGDIVAGGLFARAIEPSAGEGRGHRPGHAAGQAHGLCLNCGTALIGAHCHRCGQAGHIHRTLHSVGHDLLHGVFHFEGKIWDTLPMLVTRPGALTRRYVEGERARFVSPLALFLFTMFLMFAVFGWAGLDSWMHDPAEDGPKVAAGAAPQESQVGAGLAEIDRERARAAAAGETTRELDAVRATLAGHETSTGNVGAPGLLRALGVRLEEKGYAKVGRKLQNPELLLYKIKSSSYKYSWALIPLSLPFMWMLFAWRRQYRMYDHAIFVIYSISFMNLLFVVMALCSLSPLLSWLDGWLLLVPPIHMFAQLKGAYRLRTFSAAWRTVALLFVTALVLSIFVSLLVVLGLMG